MGLGIRLFTLLLTAAVVILSIPGESIGDADIQEDGVIYTEPKDIGRPNRLAVIEVQGFGTIKIELYENMTPITTQNFIDLAEDGFYDGIRFHRCIDNFVAQTGDPNTRNNNPYDDGSGGSDKTIPLEICENASHIDGAVGMARSSEPDSASSQFYICDGPQHGLDDWVRMESTGDHGYAVFGVVVEGLDIAKDIAGTETNGMTRPLLRDQPVDDITMTRVYIEEQVLENLTENDGEERSSRRDSPLPAIPIFIGAVLVCTIFYSRYRKR